MLPSAPRVRVPCVGPATSSTVVAGASGRNRSLPRTAGAATTSRLSSATEYALSTARANGSSSSTSTAVCAETGAIPRYRSRNVDVFWVYSSRMCPSSRTTTCSSVVGLNQDGVFTSSAPAGLYLKSRTRGSVPVALVWVKAARSRPPGKRPSERLGTVPPTGVTTAPPDPNPASKLPSAFSRTRATS